jgi:signal transduction histidine kinase
MSIRSLPWRIGLPFAACVFAGSVALVLLMGWQFERNESAHFEELASTNAEFLGERYPASEDMARDLESVLGMRVFFRRGDRFISNHPEVPEGLLGLPADKCIHRLGSSEAIAAPMGTGNQLILVRPAASLWREVWRPPTFAVLGTFWLLALLVGWLVAQGLVQPLRNLAARLPEIERKGPLELPEAGRADEIGDVARSFVRTRAALQEAREENERKEKLAVLGRMTAALAHEIQNPVAAIKMHAQLWRPEANGTAQVIEGETERIEGLLNQWLFLSRPEPPVAAPVDAAAVLAQVAEAHRAQLEHAQVQLALQAPGPLWLQGDARRLAQVFRNLLVNAVQAMPRGGTLQVTAREGAGAVQVQFLDGGRGFSPQALLRLGEFFYSEREGGMGIGLSVATEIVKAHGGSLTAGNRPEGGACVTVTLPAAAAGEPAT